MLWTFIHDPLTDISNEETMFPVFSGNSETDVLELPENTGKNGWTVMLSTEKKYSTIYWCVTRRERVKPIFLF